MFSEASGLGTFGPAGDCLQSSRGGAADYQDMDVLTEAEREYTTTKVPSI